MVRVTRLQKRFETAGSTVRAVDNLTFTVPRGIVFTLLGPSGCGKTTTLRCVAGLEHPEKGQIAVDGREVFNSDRNFLVPPNDRDIGMVFQSYAIWPHMTVAENLAFPLRVGRSRNRLSGAEIRREIKRVLDLVELAGYEDRPAPKLSGGQQQRLALARALIRKPALLLLDEPLSNLDAKLREHMRFELKRMQTDLGLTMIYVTHDQSEALTLSDIVAVMRDGRIVQAGSPLEVYEGPNSQFVANFVGTSNFLPGRVRGQADGCSAVETTHGVLWGKPVQPLTEGQNVVLCIRPEHLVLHDVSPAEAHNMLSARVSASLFLGDATDYRLLVGQQSLQARRQGSPAFPPGQGVYASLPMERCLVMPAEDTSVDSGWNAA